MSLSIKDDKLLKCKYGAFVATICRGSNNNDISWDDMHSALLRVINTDQSFGKSPRAFKVEELPSAATTLSGRDRVANLLAIYEVLEEYCSEKPNV